MAVIPTGAIFKSLVFDGEDSRDYGVYITGEAVYNAPERDVEMISIPGRNGSFALDKGRFQNIEVSYPAGIFANNEADFVQGISDFRNFLCSRNGYVRLTDEYNPNEYRMAVYKSGLEVSPTQLKAGEFQLVFDCKPQRFLTSGEEPITIGEWHETETASGSIASFEAEAGDAVKSLDVDIEPIQSLNGYDKPWSGGAGKNKFPLSVDEIKSLNTAGTWNGNVCTYNGVTFTISSDENGNVLGIKVNGTATALTEFGLYSSFTESCPFNGYILNGCPSGGSNNTYLLRVSDVTTTSSTDSGDGATINLNDTGKWRCLIRLSNGYTANNLVFKPMIRLASETDSSFSPYSNICPISGYDSVVVSRCGKNLLNLVESEMVSVGWNRLFPITLKAGTYIISCQNQFGAPTAKGARVVLTDEAGENVIKTLSGFTFGDSAFVGTAVSITAEEASKIKNIRFEARAGSTTYSDIADGDIQLELGSTATAYEPYQGTTYTTDLNGTRYGGTVDVVSGVLTVDRVAVDMGSLNWEVWSGYTSIFRCGLPSDCKTVGNQGVPNWLCSAYVVTSGVSVSSTVGAIGQLHASYVLVNNPSYTDASAFKTAMTGQTLVYELATPTTVQLTAQEVELLVGLNQIWANSGDVSVEYGTAPNVLVNPTLFESSPMLEVEGYGSININDEVVSIQNEELGTIKISGSWGAGSSMSLDTTQLNNGDTIFYNSAPYANVEVKAISGTLRITRNGAPTNGSCSISSVSTTATRIFVLPSETTFSKGTNKTVTTSVPLHVIVNGTITNCTLTLTTSYTASTETVTLSASWTSAPSTIKKTTNYRHNQYYGDSTKSILPSPMYIDLDIGEAYGVIDNEPLSFDNIVTLPAELPKLKSGVNEVTFDNTVTDLKVVPRYWKI